MNETGRHAPQPPASIGEMRANIVAGEAGSGRIAENIVLFARLLRSAGLPAGPDKAELAIRAVLAAGLDSPATLYWTLHAVFVRRASERELFAQAFAMFWRDPDFLGQMMSLSVPTLRSEREPAGKEMSRRLAEALFHDRRERARQTGERLDIHATGSASAHEQIRHKDFEQMSAQELREARRLMASLHMPFERVRSRRFEPAPSRGQPDLRRLIRNMAARGPDDLRPSYRRRRQVRRPIVILCDISGSMAIYARVFLHFIHALTNDRDRVHTFLFGTRLTNISRLMKDKDPDTAIAKASRQAPDWDGGTRIGQCLDRFNRQWARRVLGQNAVVLLFTDGLDRDGGEGISLAARRLAANCRRLVWLNPLMRHEAYQPLAAGAQALAPFVSEMRTCHNLSSLADLAQALSRPIHAKRMR